LVDYEWPVDANGKKCQNKDIGQLPFDHPIIIFLADLTHRIRCFGKYILVWQIPSKKYLLAPQLMPPFET
jgi:hypothetical protein